MGLQGQKTAPTILVLWCFKRNGANHGFRIFKRDQILQMFVPNHCSANCMISSIQFFRNP